MIQSNVKDQFETIYKPSLNLINLYLLQSFFTFSYINLLGVMGENMSASLKKSLFSALIKQDITFYDQKRAGELIDRLTTDIQDFKSSFKMCISQGLKSATQIIGCCVSLWMISPKLTIFTSTVIPLAVGVGAFFGSMLRKFSRKAQAQIAKSTGIADEAINNVRTVRAFAMEDAEIEMFADEIDKAKHLNMKLSVGIGLFQGVSNLFINGMVLGVIFFSGKLLILFF
jgi:ATP-binding cassette subfamily B (MDR/TAP) protein 8